jgi:putative FmdB family regulatory protein
MPIYAYKCESCGFAKDVLQKISDAPLQDCPTCGKSTFKKQLTAAGFQLKGSGWYVTDFKGGSAPSTAVAPAASDSSPASTEGSAAKPAEATPTPAVTPSGPTTSS